MTKLSTVHGIMSLFGTTSATSMHRAYPVQVCTAEDESSEPLDGDFTSDLFLAHRDEVQLEKNRRRSRRRELERMKHFFAGELLDELGDLEKDEDADETSELSINDMVYLDEDGKETRFGGKMVSVDAGTACTDNCPLKGWQDVQAQAEPRVAASVIATSEVPLANEPGMRDTDSGYAVPLAVTSKFSHDLLPEHHIRVLEIQPGEAAIYCKLHAVDLHAITDISRQVNDAGEAIEKFEALSYCWGSTASKKTITCNDLPVQITQNLLLALEHLRYKDKPRFIWADALCINQSSNEERSSQARQMLTIYKRASRVIVWLGSGLQEDGDLAILFLKATDNPITHALILEREHEDECMQNLARSYTALLNLLNRPWFRRTWIRQELAAGRKFLVQCGNHTILWNTLKRSSQRTSSIRAKLQGGGEYADLSEYRLGTLEYLKRGWAYGQRVLGTVAVAGSFYYWHGGGLLELLLISENFEATDPRDRVYAVLGLAREPIAGGDNEDALFPYVDEGEVLEAMTVDYDSTVSEVYQRPAKYVINRDLNLDVLCLGGTLRDERSSDLPSWTPDWRVPWNSSLFGYLQLKFFASSSTRAEKQNQIDLGRLKVKAYMVDEIVELLDMTAEPWDLMYEDGEAVIGSRGEIANQTKWRKLPLFHEFKQGESRKRCCMTRLGHVALVPPGARVGDHIFILLGARLPFVLRPVVQDGEGNGPEGKKKLYWDMFPRR